MADGKVYVGDEDGDFVVFAATKEKKILSEVNMGAPVLFDAHRRQWHDVHRHADAPLSRSPRAPSPEAEAEIAAKRASTPSVMATPDLPAGFTTTQWLIIIIASIGFLFDTYELLMTPLVAAPAIAELLKVPQNNPLVTEWVGRLLWIAALCGGVFGLLGGWLVDKLGRKTVMALSIFVYSLSPFCAAYATSLPMFVFFRCTTFIGVCVEFVAAITWLAEVFEDKKQREKWLGITQAFASLGGVLVTLVSIWISSHGKDLPHMGLPLGLGVDGPRLVALSADDRPAARDPDRAAAALRAGVAGVEGEARRRHAEAPELRRALRAGTAPRHDRHGDPFRVRLRHRVRRAAGHRRPRHARPAGAEAAGRRRSRRCARKARRSNTEAQCAAARTIPPRKEIVGADQGELRQAEADQRGGEEDGRQGAVPPGNGRAHRANPARGPAHRRHEPRRRC